MRVRHCRCLHTSLGKIPKFTLFPGVDILWKGKVSIGFWAIRPKLYGNCAFPQNFHTRKFGGISVSYTLEVTQGAH